MSDDDDLLAQLQREARSATRPQPARESPAALLAQLANEAERALGKHARAARPQLDRLAKLLAQTPSPTEARQHRQALLQALDKLERLCDALLER